MRAFLVRSAIGAALLAASAGAMAQAGEEPLAQPPADECTMPVPPAGPLAPWVDPVFISAAKDAAHLGDVQLLAGHAARLHLYPMAEVRFPVPPGRPGGTGGLAEVTIAKAGNYRVALGTPAWIDLVAGGKPLTSIAHGHGPKCSSIHKVVDFTLQPGRYTLMISANPGDHTQVLVAKLP